MRLLRAHPGHFFVFVFMLSAKGYPFGAPALIHIIAYILLKHKHNNSTIGRRPMSQTGMTGPEAAHCHCAYTSYYYGSMLK